MSEEIRTANPGGSWFALGVLLLAASIGLLLFSSNMSPTVDATSYDDFGRSSRIFNLGLLQQQLMIFHAGLVGLVLSIAAFATAAVLRGLAGVRVSG